MKGVLTADGRKCLTDLLIDLILPCNIINSFLIDLSSEVLIASLEVLLIALGIQILCWLGGKVLFGFAEPGKKKVLQYATICSNAGFMGNPIIEGIYGQEGLLYASVYLIPLRFFYVVSRVVLLYKGKGERCAAQARMASMYRGCLDWLFLYADRNFNSISNFAYAPLFEWLYASGIYFDYRFNSGRGEYPDNFYEADPILQRAAAAGHSTCHASDLQNSWNLGAGDRRFCLAGRNAGRKHDCDSGRKI